MRTTHTYVELEISRTAYEEIRTKLKAAGYDHAFEIGDRGDGAIDMQGIAVIPAKADESWWTRCVAAWRRETQWRG